MDDPPTVTEPGEKPPVTPNGAPPSENVTDSALPFVTAVPIVVGADAPWTTLTDPGDALIEKSLAAVTVSVTPVEWVADAPVPVTVRL